MQLATLILAGGAFVMSATTLIGAFVIGKRIKKDVDNGIATATDKVATVKDALASIQSVL